MKRDNLNNLPSVNILLYKGDKIRIQGRIGFLDNKKFTLHIEYAKGVPDMRLNKYECKIKLVQHVLQYYPSQSGYRMFV